MPQRHALTSIASLPPGSGRAFTVGERRIAVFNVDGKFHAIDDTCPHEGASLAEGSLEGTTVTCPWHAAEFDITTGRVLCLPALDDVQSIPVFVNGDTLEVEL